MADALSKKEDTYLKTKIEKETVFLQAKAQGSLYAISFPFFTWLEELKANYDKDETVKDLIGKL